MPDCTTLPFWSESECALSHLVDRFAQSVIAPRAETIDQNNVFPRDLWQQLGELGCFGLTVPSEFGGAGLGYVAQLIAMTAISAASGAVGLSYAAHENLCLNQLVRFGSIAQKMRYLPKLISGTHVGALAISEHQAGSDCLSLKLKATEATDGYVLNGQKMWVTNAPDADLIIVYARTSTDRKRSDFTAFIIDKTLSGWHTGPKIEKMGMRGSNTSAMIFDQCFVPHTHILGKVSQGCEILMTGLNYERIVLSGGPIGIMKACLSTALPYVRERHQFGQPIGTFQLIEAKISDIYTAYQASKTYAFSIALQCDQGSITPEDAASCFLFSAEKATQVALETIQVLGGNGYTLDYPAQRYLRDAKLYEIGGGTSEIRRTLIGQALFKQAIF